MGLVRERRGPGRRLADVPRRPALTGVAASSLPERLDLLWTFKAAGPVKSSPAIVQGRVFIGSDDGNVYALALADGKKVWAFKTGGEIESSPSCWRAKCLLVRATRFFTRWTPRPASWCGNTRQATKFSARRIG